MPITKGPSAHFTWHDVNPHNFAGLTLKLRINARTQAKKLEQLRVEVNKARVNHKLKPTGINTLSWWRPQWYNFQIGGAAQSQHIYARATDISEQEIHRLMPWDGGKKQFDQLCERIFKTGGFGTYPGGSRHVDTRGFRSRWSTFRSARRS
jgi:uncharacterized protein YcbK (DUF882 family)